ncbi:MAG TPA: hypothetical protein VLJ86_16990 [Ramlibacter sp.]|nr:hypothetical protein [Ramlibacter sp.]
MFDIRKLFVRSSPASSGHAAEDDINSEWHPDQQEAGLETEYLALIMGQLRRSGVSPSCASVEARRLGRAPDGLDVMGGMIRLHRWERDSAMRLMIGLPLIETRVRRAFNNTWLSDYSHFGGLWLHTSERLRRDGGMHEVKAMLAVLQEATAAGARPQEPFFASMPG